MRQSHFGCGLFVRDVAVALFIAASLARAETGVAQRYPISDQQILQLLRIKGVSLEPAAIHLTARVTSASASPQLQIVSIARSGSDQFRLGLRCDVISECLPFSVLVDSGATDLRVLTNP